MSKGGSSSMGMESRVGRDNQRYSPKGERLVAGVVPISADKRQVLMIQSTRRKGWVLPKGGWEQDEECTQAAEREAWEEAGIFVQIDYDLGDIVDTRPPKKHSSSSSSSGGSGGSGGGGGGSKHGKDGTRCLYRFYQVSVLSEEPEWPEMDKRDRKWMSYAEAKEHLRERPELKEALDRSTIKK